jgi:hypothetical protein
MKRRLVMKETHWAIWLSVAAIWILFPMTLNAQEIKLVVRGDDFGMTQGSLIAFEKGFNEGILTCGSILAQAPWFEGAAALARKNRKWCIGIHLSLIGEWIGYRWRPVLPWDKVSSIVDEDGFLFTDPEELFKRNPRIEEIDAELRAQIALARKGEKKRNRYPISRHPLHGNRQLSRIKGCDPKNLPPVQTSHFFPNGGEKNTRYLQSSH